MSLGRDTLGPNLFLTAMAANKISALKKVRGGDFFAICAFFSQRSSDVLSSTLLCIWTAGFKTQFGCYLR
jgi:hypothetical protein